MDDLHLSFKERVRASRGDRLTGRDEELFSGKLELELPGLQAGWVVRGIGCLLHMQHTAVEI